MLRVAVAFETCGSRPTGSVCIPTRRTPPYSCAATRPSTRATIRVSTRFMDPPKRPTSGVGSLGRTCYATDARRAMGRLLGERSAGLEAWIERVAQAVAEQVEAQHHHHDGEPRRHGRPRCEREEAPPLGHH